MSENGGGGGGSGMIMIILLLFMCCCSFVVSAAGGFVLWKNPDLMKKIFGDVKVPGPNGVPVPAPVPGPGGAPAPGPAPPGASTGSEQSPTYGGGGGSRESNEQCNGYVKSIEVSAWKKDIGPAGPKGDKTHVTGWKVNCDDGTKKDFGILKDKPRLQECPSGFSGFNIWLGKDGKLVQAMQPKCVDGKVLDTHGNPDGNPKQQWYCPNGKKVVGFSGMSGGWLDSVSWTCR